MSVFKCLVFRCGKQKQVFASLAVHLAKTLSNSGQMGAQRVAAGSRRTAWGRYMSPRYKGDCNNRRNNDKKSESTSLQQYWKLNFSNTNAFARSGSCIQE